MKVRKNSLVIAVLSLMFLSPYYAFAEKATEIVLKSDEWTVSVYPRSLQVAARPERKGWVQISASQEDLGSVENLKRSGTEVSWELPQQTLTVSALAREPNSIC